MFLYAEWHSDTIIAKNNINTSCFPYSAIVSKMAKTEMDNMIEQLTGEQPVNISMISHCHNFTIPCGSHKSIGSSIS